MGRGYKGTKFYRKRSRDDDEEEDGRRAFEERHKGSYPLEEIKVSSDYCRKLEVQGPKRKYAICLGYVGSAYQGLQINPDANTIEAELERALYLSGAIPEWNFGNLQKLQWSRAARTDGGVHAVAQCCSMRLTIPLENRSAYIDTINSFLPSDIRIHAISKVTKGFNAKLYCIRRRYHYLLPTYLLSNQSQVIEYIEAEFAKADVITAPFTTYSDTPGISTSVPMLTGSSLASIRDKVKSFRITEMMLIKLKEALNKYVGTSNYHNFTSGKSFKDANSKRYIVSFDCGEPFLVQESGIEYLLLSVIGQSFLLNQIRKMIAMAIEVARGRATLDTMTLAFSEEKFEIPMVPGTGLYLDELFYDGYNDKVDHIIPHTTKSSQKDKPMEQRDSVPISEESSSSTVVATATATATVTLADDNEGEEDTNNQVTHERLEWQQDPKVGPILNLFRENVIWPHIYSQEEKGLNFITYLDFLRISAHNITLFKDP